MTTNRELIAHVLRRTTFGPFPGEIDRFVGLGPDAVIDDVLGDPRPFALSEAEAAERTFEGESKFDLVYDWLDRLVTPDARLHERMTWYWHGHLTSNVDKATPITMWRQHHTLRRHALGNFRDLMKAITIDGAMLLYLDGVNSIGASPNENYARELMELFTLGPGNYTEADIRSGAHGLSGWKFDSGSSEVSFDADDHWDRPETFLGATQVWTHDAIVDQVCDQPACAPFVAGRMFRFFVGVDPSESTRDRLGSTFRDSGLEIAALVEAILRSPEFLTSVRTRTRQPLEWTAAALRLVDAREQFHMSWLEAFGQAPFFPPNVAGWPDDDRWLGPGQHLSRAQRLLSVTPGPGLDEMPGDVDGALAHVGLDDVSDATRTTMRNAAASVGDAGDRRRLLAFLALLSPEFATL